MRWACTETVIITDTVSKLSRRFRYTAEAGVLFTDSCHSAAVKLRTILETAVKITDTVAKRAKAFRSLSETVVLVILNCLSARIVSVVVL